MTTDEHLSNAAHELGMARSALKRVPADHREAFERINSARVHLDKAAASNLSDANAESR